MSAGLDSHRVELAHGLVVGQVVRLPEANETFGLVVDKSLDTVGLDNTANIRIGEDGTGEEVSILDSGGLVSSSEYGVELLEGGLSPDDEATKVTSRGKEQEIQSRHTSDLNASQVSESALGSGSLVSNNDKGTNLDFLGSVPQAGLARVFGGVLAPFDISIGLEFGQESKGILGLGEIFDSISGNYQGNFRDGRDVVSAGHDDSGHCGGSQGRRNSVPLLVDVYLTVPPSPGAGGSEHSSTTAHVTEGSLTCTVCATTRHSWNTSHSSTSTPRNGRSLCTCPLRNRVWDSGVLAKVGLNILNDVASDGCVQHGRGGNLPNHLTVPAIYLN